MSTDEFEAIPEDEWKALSTTEITHLTDEEKEHLPHAWDEWIARVRRDAKAEAWDEGCRAAEQFYKRTVVGLPNIDPIPAPLNPYRYETGGSDEHR